MMIPVIIGIGYIFIPIIYEDRKELKKMRQELKKPPYWENGT